MDQTAGTHHWKFFHAGEFDQVALTEGADLMALDQLDQKLWAALACPVNGLYFDHKTLALIDTDNDARVRAPELIAAIKWAGSLLKNPDGLLNSDEALSLDAIDDSTEDGAAMLASARHVLELIGKADATALSVEDTDDAASRFAQMLFNGDGIVTEDATDDEDVRAVLQDIIACLGADTDLSGKPGISRAKLEAFLAAGTAYVEWSAQTGNDKTILPLGADTAAAAAAIAAVRAKVTDYFTRCRLAAFDPRASAALNRDEKEYLALAAGELVPGAAEIAAFPLAHVEPGKPLTLTKGINPAWETAIGSLYRDAIVPLLGARESLTEADWQALQAKVAPFDSWNVAMADSGVRALPLERLREILAGKAPAALDALIARDEAEAGTANAIQSVDRLVRYCRNLRQLCDNFVNFRQFYSGDESAIFQAGVLYLDQRSCELTLLVDDAAKASSMIAMAGTYLVFCDCMRKGSGEKRQIVAAFTNGDADNLMVGRNGIYYDREGRDWDATITKIIENPISLRQAFWAPYKKLVRLIEEQVAKRAAAAEASSSAKMEQAAIDAASVDQAKPPEGKKIDVGTVAAMGVAFGALATAVAAIAGYASGLFKLPFWQLCLALGVLMLIISGPSMVIAWLKLRKRNLAPILDATGWAVNARARISVPFGASLTGIARLPRGSRVSAQDKFGERPSMWPKLLLFVVVIGFFYSLLNYYGVIEMVTGGMFGDPAGSQPGLEVLIPPTEGE